MIKFLQEFFDRIFGAVMFIAAVGAFISAYNSLTVSINDTKTIYANDQVYSEGNLAVTDQSIIKGSELKMILMNCPNKNVVIKNIRGDSCWLVSIRAGKGAKCGFVEKLITGETDYYSSDIKFSDEELKGGIQFGIDKWFPEKLNLDQWIYDNELFQITPITNTLGEVIAVSYMTPRNLE